MHMFALSHKWTLHLPPAALYCSTVYRAPYGSEIFAWKLNPESRLIVSRDFWVATSRLPKELESCNTNSHFITNGLDLIRGLKLTHLCDFRLMRLIYGLTHSGIQVVFCLAPDLVKVVYEIKSVIIIWLKTNIFIALSKYKNQVCIPCSMDHFYFKIQVLNLPKVNIKIKYINLPI